MNILIENAIVLPMTGSAGSPGERYFTGNVGIAGDRIVYVGRADGAAAEDFRRRHADGLRVIDGRGKLVMPGLVNVHNHVAMTLMRGYADDLALMEWLRDYIWPYEARMTSDDIRLGAELGIAEMLLGGTTTFTDMYWHETAVAEAVEKGGIRAVLSPAMTDFKLEDFKKDFAALAEKYGAGQNPLISLMISPHAPYTCSRETLLYALELSRRHGVGINIHVSETADEQNIIRRQHGMTPVEYLDSLGLLSPSTLVVHAVHVDDNDIAIMKRHGVSVAHNPQSNMKLASGISPVAGMLAAGLNVGIGTDGPSSNNDLDMWEELRDASFLQKVGTLDPTVLPAYQALEMATTGGAKAVGLGDKVGRLKEGMLADVIVLDIEKPHLYPRLDVVANLAYCARSSDVETVIVGGEIVVEQRKATRLDTLSLCRLVQARAQEIAAGK